MNRYFIYERGSDEHYTVDADNSWSRAALSCSTLLKGASLRFSTWTRSAA